MREQTPEKLGPLFQEVKGQGHKPRRLPLTVCFFRTAVQERPQEIDYLAPPVENPVITTLFLLDWLTYFRGFHRKPGENSHLRVPVFSFRISLCLTAVPWTACIQPFIKSNFSMIIYLQPWKTCHRFDIQAYVSSPVSFKIVCLLKPEFLCADMERAHQPSSCMLFGSLVSTSRAVLPWKFCQSFCLLKKRVRTTMNSSPKYLGLRPQ